MISQTFVLAVGGALLLGALPVLLARRDEARAARGMAITALVVLWYAAFDWLAAAQVEQPSELRVVATGGGDGRWSDQLRAAMEPGQALSIHAAGGRPLAAAWLAAELVVRDPRDVALVWDGPFVVDERRPDRAAGVRSFTTVPPAVVEPGDVAVRALGSLAVGRPAALEVDLAAAARAALTGDRAVRIRVLGADGAVVVDRELAAADFDAGAARVAWTPAVVGAFVLEVELRAGASTVRAAGSVEVGAKPPPVAVVGRGAGVVVAALVAQAVDAVAHGELPPELTPAGVVVALDPLDEFDQRRLDEYCDLGGGVVLVGGADGGALPIAGAPLAAACPLVRFPEPADDAAGAGTGAGRDQADGGPATGDPNAGEVEEPKVAPPVPDPPPSPGQREQPDTPVTGETSAARDSKVESAEVERRGVALVLVVDRSGSMGELVGGRDSKMDFAKRSAFETAGSLERTDELGIVAFGSRAYDVLPLGPVPTPGELRRAIEALRATDGQTLLGDALERAGTWLSASTAPIRHAVVITDGELPDPGDRTRAQGAALRMGRSGITVSLIQIAATRFGAASEIATIANLGNGQFVRETDGSAIPRLVFAEVRRALGAAGRRPSGDVPTPGAAPGAVGAEPDSPTAPAADSPGTGSGPDQPTAPEPKDPKADQPVDPAPAAAQTLRVVAVDDSPLLAPEPESGFPDLLGANHVAASPRALVLLATVDGTPVLAFAHRGLGRIAAWAADWSGPWSARWREDPSFPARLAVWVGAVRPAPAHASDVDRLDGARSLTPAAPTRAEWAALTALGDGAGPADVAGLRPAPPRVRESTRGRAADLAFAGLLALLLLALVEWRTRLA